MNNPSTFRPSIEYCLSNCDSVKVAVSIHLWTVVYTNDLLLRNSSHTQICSSCSDTPKAMHNAGTNSSSKDKSDDGMFLSHQCYAATKSKGVMSSNMTGIVVHSIYNDNLDNLS